MKVYVSENDRNKFVRELDGYLKELITEAVTLSLARKDYGNNCYINGVSDALAGRVCALEDIINMEYLPEKLTFYTFNNLRCQQDGVVSVVKRFDKLEDAVKEYNSLPKEYTSALGGCLGEMKEIDFIHRRNGESVLVTDYRNMEHWANNGLVKQAIQQLIDLMGIEYESDIKNLGTSCPILIPISNQEKINSYFKDKYLYSKISKQFLSAINEVFEEGEGWINFAEFYQKINDISPSKETYRPKVTKYNISYIDSKGRIGHADISPTDFAFMKKQTEERFSERPQIDSQIKGAEKKVTSKDVRNCKEICREER